MGKVGSSTVLRSLRSSSLDLPVHHVHFLSGKGIDRVKSIYQSKNAVPPDHIHRSRRIRWRIDAGEQNWLIVTLFREPIARKISDLFENAGTLWPELVNENGRIDPNRARERVLDELADFDEETDYVCTWFDNELQSVFDIDLFDKPFDHQQGYVIRESRSAQALVLRLEDLDSTFQPALKQFLPGEPEVEMVRTNVRTNQDANAGAYQAVKQNLTVPDKVAERIYSSQYMQHLYTDEMIERFLSRWCSQQ
jgi:hypothetical protein